MKCSLWVWCASDGSWLFYGTPNKNLPPFHLEWPFFPETLLNGRKLVCARTKCSLVEGGKGQEWNKAGRFLRVRPVKIRIEIDTPEEKKGGGEKTIEVGVSKTETASPGNAAAMREALQAINNTAQQYLFEGAWQGDNSAGRNFKRFLDWLTQGPCNALATPPRNYDLYDGFPAAFNAWRVIDPREAGSFYDWLFAEAKGGTM